MEIKELIKSELGNFGKYERIIFPIVITFVFIISLISKDSIFSIISAICGISYTILAGKGRVSCYIIGFFGSLCYSYLALVNKFYGNLLLYVLYYIPMDFVGIYKWSKHLKKEQREIEKTKLNEKERLLYFGLAFFLSILLAAILHYLEDKNPIIDAITTIFSILGLFLTVKRCIEQWYIWFIVNFLSLIMWIIAYINGSNCLATVLMWLVYLILAVYFLKVWKKEVK